MHAHYMIHRIVQLDYIKNPIASGAGEDILLKETERSSSGSAQGSSQKKQPQPLLLWVATWYLNI